MNVSRKELLIFSEVVRKQKMKLILLSTKRRRYWWCLVYIFPWVKGWQSENTFIFMTEISVDKVNGDNPSDNFSNSVIPILIYWLTVREQEEGEGRLILHSYYQLSSIFTSKGWGRRRSDQRSCWKREMAMIWRCNL